MRWRLEGPDEVRRAYAHAVTSSRAPLLVCANHLTMLDSFVIGWAIGSPGLFFRHFRAMPWNTPERVHFASNWWKRALVYVLKCVPVTRGSDRKEVALVLEKIRFVMALGESALLFPEGGRSRSGRVELESAAYGVGRLVSALPGCRVFCVYLRGVGQDSWSDAPRRGERFRMRAACIEPKTDAKGLRGSLDLSRQIVAQLVELEQGHFDDRQ